MALRLQYESGHRISYVKLQPELGRHNFCFTSDPDQATVFPFPDDYSLAEQFCNVVASVPKIVYTILEY